MLVLTRKIGEELIIGDNITVKIVEISSNKVRIAIDAPRDVSVDRKEVHDKKEKELESAVAKPTAVVEKVEKHVNRIAGIIDKVDQEQSQKDRLKQIRRKPR